MNKKNITSQEKTLGVVSHLAPLAGYLVAIGHILVPLIILLTKGKDSKFVEFHARESFNFQISMTIYWMITIILMFLLVGLVLAIPLALFQFIVMIIAAIKAGNGEKFRYPLCIRFVK